MKKELQAKGLKSQKIFFGGHSLGGASVTAWVHENTDEAEGAFGWGSYVSRLIEDPAKNYGVPYMTVGAQFDGWMARVTRIAIAYDQMKSSSIGYENSKYSYPVILIPGANHASFLSGDPPQVVKETDLRP
jgi:predicted esterase